MASMVVMTQTPILFRGPGALGPRTILVLVALLNKETTARDLVHDLGFSHKRTPDALTMAVSATSAVLRKLEDRGLVTAEFKLAFKRKRTNGQPVKNLSNILHWTLTARGRHEAKLLEPAVRAMRKSKLGLAVIRGTAMAAA